MRFFSTVSHESYHLHRPARQIGPVLVSSPHSGAEYSAEFLEICQPDPLEIRSSEDAFVDSLVADAPKWGAALLCARAPRAFIDLNRAADELDPALIANLPRAPHNPRIASGLGVIPRVVGRGRAIYSGKISLADAQSRIARWWSPWHRALERQMSETAAQHGQAILLDMHSMPHDALSPLRRGLRSAPLPEIVIGDRFGASASDTVTAQIEASFQAEGFRTSRNTPFAGAYITQSYGQPRAGRHAVQIEIDRSLYMNEWRLEKHADFDSFAARVGRALRRVIEHHGQPKLVQPRKNPPLAAE